MLEYLYSNFGLNRSNSFQQSFLIFSRYIAKSDSQFRVCVELRLITSLLS